MNFSEIYAIESNRPKWRNDSDPPEMPTFLTRHQLIEELHYRSWYRSMHGENPKPDRMLIQLRKL